MSSSPREGKAVGAPGAPPGCYYSSYLRLDQLLSIQQPASDAAGKPALTRCSSLPCTRSTGSGSSRCFTNWRIESDFSTNPVDDRVLGRIIQPRPHPRDPEAAGASARRHGDDDAARLSRFPRPPLPGFRLPIGPVPRNRDPAGPVSGQRLDFRPGALRVEAVRRRPRAPEAGGGASDASRPSRRLAVENALRRLERHPVPRRLPGGRSSGC